MELTKTLEGNKLTIAAEGHLNTTTAPELEKMINESVEGVTELILDFEKLEYISSAGLRVLLQTQKLMSKQGALKITHVCAEIMSVLEMTGFADILTIE